MVYRPVQIALKEWAVTVEALRQGRQIILLRKGGIHEPHGDFRVEHEEFFLFPGYEHQDPALLRPAEAARYANLFDPALEGGPLRLAVLARMAQVIDLRDAATAFRLADHHLWTEDYVRKRVEYKPERPLHVFIVRAHALPAVEIPRLERYAGCRSWVELGEPVSAAGARAVLDDAEFQRRVEAVRAAVGA